MYRMPKKRRPVRNSLQFEVPLIRLVMPLDSPDGKSPTSLMKASSALHLQTLLRLIRIETRFEDLLTPKAPPSIPGSGQTQPVPARTKKSNRTLKASATGKRRSSSQPKKK